MGLRQHELHETDALLARKDDQISTLDARLHQTIAHLSLVRARLLSTLDQLDALQQEHTAAQAAAAHEQQGLEAKLRAAEEIGREGEADRMDMRDAVGTLVKRVEATPDFRHWPRSQIHLSSLSEPLLLSSTHPTRTSSSKSHRTDGPTSIPEDLPLQDQNNHAALIEQLAYATTLVSHFRSERDEALVRAEHGEARVLQLEARLARREAALEACAGCRICATAATALNSRPKLTSRPARTSGDSQSSPPLDVRPHFVMPPFAPPPIANNPDPEPDEIVDILDVSVERNRELEREVKQLSRRLEKARAARAARRPRSAASDHLRRHGGESEHEDEQHVPAHLHGVAERARGHVPPLHRQREGDASLLPSLSFSPPSSTSSTATPGAAAGTVTQRQHESQQDEYRHQPYPSDEAVYYDYDNVDERSLSTYEDADEDEDEENESVTQAVDELKPAALPTADTGIHADYNGSVVSDDPSGLKPVVIPVITKPATTGISIPVPVPALHALGCQIALLGAKIDAFAAERRAMEGLVGGSAGLNLNTLGLGIGADSPAKVDLDLGAVEVEVVRTDEDPEAQYTDIKVTGGGRKEARVGDGAGTGTRVDQHDERSHSDASGLRDGSAQNEGGRVRCRPEDAEHDHPHGACEATLLAARRREMELEERVRVLQGALSAVQLGAQTEMRERKDSKCCGGSGADVLERCRAGGGTVAVAQAPPTQEDETQARWVDAAVQTLDLPSQSPLVTPTPGGDLLGFDGPELHVVGEERRNRTERGLEGMLEREDEAEGTDDGEMPMELATPLLPVHAIPAPDANDDNDWEEPRNGNEQVPYGLASEATSSLEEDLDAGSEWDPPDVSADYIEFQSAIGVLANGQRQPPVDECELRAPQEVPESSTACLHPSAPPATRPLPPCSPTHDLASPLARQGNPSPPSSTGTSPTIAVGLLPPLPPLAHLSLPLPLLHRSHSHSRPASSSLSALLPLPNPHSGLHRAHTDPDIGMDSQRTGSAHRFVMYRATSSFVAELRQVESRLAETAVSDEGQRAFERVEGVIAPAAPDVEGGGEDRAGAT